MEKCPNLMGKKVTVSLNAYAVTHGYILALFPSTACPSGSIPNSLEVTLTFPEGDAALHLVVKEPGGAEPSLQKRLGVRIQTYSSRR